MQDLTRLFAVLGFVLGSSAVFAQNSFDYLEVGAGRTDFDVGADRIDADTYSFMLSKDYRERFLLTVEYAQLLFNGVPDFDLQQDLYSVRLGYYFNVFSHVDVYGGLAYEAADSELETGSAYDYGLGGTVGLRSRPFRDWEFDASLDYTRYENPIALTGPKLIFRGEARWYFNDSLSVGFGGTYGEYESSWFGNFRLSFDPELNK